MAAERVQIRIRAMAGGDLERVMALAGELETAPQWGRAAYEAAIAVDARPRRFALVGEAEGVLVGFVVASAVAGQAELESIAVAADAQRRGVAKVLLGELILRLKTAGVEEMLAEVRVSNLAAVRLYAGLGFEEMGRRRNYYAYPEEDALLLRRRL